MELPIPIPNEEEEEWEKDVALKKDRLPQSAGPAAESFTFARGMHRRHGTGPGPGTGSLLSPQDIPHRDPPAPGPHPYGPHHHHHHHRHHKRTEFSCGHWCQETWENITTLEILLHLLGWLLFLVVGILFYSLNGNTEAYGFYRGFYYTVNVGYSIGWCYSQEETYEMKIFSSLYCFFGVFVMSYLVIFFSYKIYIYHLRWDKKWHLLQSETREHERAVKHDAGSSLSVFWDDVGKFTNGIAPRTLCGPACVLSFLIYSPPPYFPPSQSSFIGRTTCSSTRG